LLIFNGLGALAIRLGLGHGGSKPGLRAGIL
jgi:hypothetical protein